MPQMPRKLPPFVTRERTRHKTVVFYFRRGKGARIRLPAITDKGFDAAYKAVLAGALPRKTTNVPTHTLAWLIARYRETAKYAELSQATRKQRDNIFKGMQEHSADAAYRKIDRTDIDAGLEDRAFTPSQARNFLDAVRGLFQWALAAKHVDHDPTAGVVAPPRPKTDGFAAWTEDDILAYEARWPEGTKERVWLHVLLFTGLRRGDAVRIGRQHVRDGTATLKTEKTGMEVSIPILPMLEETLTIGPTGDLAFICGENRRPLTKESFGNMFRTACNEAGIKGKSAHGVRKIGATRAAEAGASVAEMEALFAWKGGTMASHYTQTADRKRLAKQAAEKVRKSLRQRPHPLDGGAGKMVKSKTKSRP